MKYTIPFSFKTNCTIEVEAHDLDCAIEKVAEMAQIKDGYSRLLHGMAPVINHKADLDSVVIDEDEAEELNPKKTYEVLIRRTQSMTITVEAHSEEDALDAANGKYDDGEFDESEFDDEEVEAVEATPED
jgi:hypothetical protein